MNRPLEICLIKTKNKILSNNFQILNKNQTSKKNDKFFYKYLPIQEYISTYM